MPELSKWMGRPILKEDHKDQLETNAALLEFEHGLPRAEAEEKAYSDYMFEHHRQGVAHHLRGMRAAWANRDLKAAELHGQAYDLHMKGLGYDSLDEIPPEIKALADENEKDHYRFKGHSSDQLLA